MSTTRVLRERKSSRPMMDDYGGSPPQVSHHLPQAYGQDTYRGFTPSSEPSTDYNSPVSSDWLPETPGAYDPDYLSPAPQYIGHTAMRSYGRGSPLTIADSRYPATNQWMRNTNVAKKPKKSKKDKKDNEASIMPGDQPVPILSIDDEAPILAIERFVHRPLEDRHKETNGKNGKIPRPMNQFMLYRKAFQDKAKKVSNQNNHQLVSVVVSKSWKQESKEVRDRFAVFSQLEKDHHLQAFPGYQFRPNKSAKGKKRSADDLDDESSDLEELNWQRAPPSKIARTSVPPSLPTHYTSELQHQYAQQQQAYPQINYANDYSNSHLYYDQQTQWHDPNLQYEDISWHDTNQFKEPVSQSYTAIALSGLPGGGVALLDPNFSNDVFGEAVTTAEERAMLPSTTLGSGAFTQNEFDSLDQVPAISDWPETRTTSVGAATLLASTFQDNGAVLNTEYFSAAG